MHGQGQSSRQVAVGALLTAAIPGRLPRMTTCTDQHGHAPTSAQVGELRQVACWATPPATLTIGPAALAVTNRRAPHVAAIIAAALTATGLPGAPAATSPTPRPPTATTRSRPPHARRDHRGPDRYRSHRSAASALSIGLVLKAMAAPGACRRTRLTTVSKNSSNGSCLRIPPPMTTQA